MRARVAREWCALVLAAILCDGCVNYYGLIASGRKVHVQV